MHGALLLTIPPRLQARKKLEPLWTCAPLVVKTNPPSDSSFSSSSGVACRRAAVCPRELFCVLFMVKSIFVRTLVAYFEGMRVTRKSATSCFRRNPQLAPRPVERADGSTRTGQVCVNELFFAVGIIKQILTFIGVRNYRPPLLAKYGGDVAGDIARSAVWHVTAAARWRRWCATSWGERMLPDFCHAHGVEARRGLVLVEFPHLAGSGTCVVVFNIDVGDDVE